MTDDKIDSLLSNLDKAAREYDHYDYGLPLHEESGVDLRRIVREWLNTMACDEAFIRDLAGKHPNGLHVS